MPLTGRVAGYRQPSHSQLMQQQYDPNMAIYGYMDDQKISMIQQWVDCQASQRHVVHQQQHQKAMMQQKLEPEPFAWLNEPQLGETEDGCRVLTQFKTVESDDSAEEILQVVHQSVDVDVHISGEESMPTPPLSPNIIVPEDKEEIEQVLDQPDQPEKAESEPQNPTEYIRTIDELYNHCEQLVETLSQASEELKAKTESKESSEENLHITPMSLDANKLHFANRNQKSPSSTVFSDLVNEVKVCEDTTKFDQLAKLHELYQSVSNINDKAKSHLEEAKNRNEIKSSCLSLSALMTDLERISMNSDANSLCSEPVKMYDYNDFQNNPAALNSEDNVNLDDLFDFCNKNSTTTMSLGDLSTKQLLRSDSPILEGIDQELAKYAKLKDLEQAYHPQQNNLRNLADGASNPDLNSNSCRRSPGNGRSASEPEDELDLQSKRINSTDNAVLASDGQSMSSGGSSSTVPNSKSSPSGCSSMSSSSNEASASTASNNVLHRNTKRSSRDERTVLGKSQSTDTSSELEIWQKKPQQPQQPQQPQLVIPTPASASKKGPKFSRLFKLSRSPLKVIQESNRRSKSADSRKNLKDPSKKSIISSHKLKKEDKKVSSSQGSLKQPQPQSKNAKGTSSSIASSSKHHHNSNKNHMVPSPYSVPTAPKLPLKNSASTASSGSGYDSGHDSGILVKSRPSRFIKTCTFVKLRRSGDPKSSIGGGGASKINMAASNRGSQRKSSGYESSAGGVDSSERDSIDSLKALEPTEQPQKKSIVGLEPLPVIKYEESFIQKLDERWRSLEVRRLQQQQTQLKDELKEAKDRIKASKWTFGLHVADSVQKGRVKSTDPAIVEALQQETNILGKRIDAAKSHAILTTSFDVDKAQDNCCTTDCEPPEMILLARQQQDRNSSAQKSSQETEIF